MTTEILILSAELLHVLSAFVVMAEALNKIERVCPLADGLTNKDRWLDVIKGVAWVSMAIGAGGAIASPVLFALGIPASSTQPFFHKPPSFAEVATMFGLAAFIVRNRLKEK